MPKLFDFTGDNLDQGYLNLQEGAYQCERETVVYCETLWERFQPYADKNFCGEFARNPDARFWELWLGNYLLDKDLPLVKEADIPNRQAGAPDFCIQHSNYKVWIEAIAPTPGDDGNIDRIPALFDENTEGVHVGRLRARPENPVLLRITSALRAKKLKFDRYREIGTISPEDKCIIAINGACFALQANDQFIPDAYKAVYPLGHLQVTVDKKTGHVVRQSYAFEPEIPRRGGGLPIERSAFLSEEYTQISGMIWSRISLGNYNANQRSVMMIHNLRSEISLEPRYTDWDKEFVTAQDENELLISDIALPIT